MLSFVLERFGADPTSEYRYFQVGNCILFEYDLAPRVNECLTSVL